MSFKALKDYLELLNISGLDELFIKDLKLDFLNNSQEITISELERKNCTSCPLSTGRTNLVFGVGNPHAELIVIGDAPSKEDDIAGTPFMGESGELLTKMLSAIKINRDDVFLTNIVKCRPPADRKPLPMEVNKCIKFLHEEIKVLNPKAILILGRSAAINLLKKIHSIDMFRQGSFSFEGIKTFVTYHPTELIKNPSLKKPAYIDLLNLQKFIETK